MLNIFGLINQKLTNSSKLRDVKAKIKFMSGQRPDNMYNIIIEIDKKLLRDTRRQ